MRKSYDAASVVEFANYVRTHHYGPDSAVPASKLAYVFGMQDLGTNGRRDRLGSHALTKLMNRARRAGHPICYNSKGIFYARHIGDAQHMLKQYRARTAHYHAQSIFLEIAAYPEVQA